MPNRPAQAAGWRLLGAAALALLVSACEESRTGLDHRLDDATAINAGDPALRHPIGFASRPVRLEIEVPAGGVGLSPNQNIDVYRFLLRYKREGTERLAISVPTGTRDRRAVAMAQQDIERHVIEAGIPYEVLRTARHDRSSGGTTSIRLAYQRLVALPPQCGYWTEDVGRNEERINYPNWGCAIQRNLAVMVDNARDLNQPQDEDPRASERRSVMWSSYTSSGSSNDEGTSEAKKVLSATK